MKKRTHWEITLTQEREIKKLKLVLGTLIVWLQRELGTKGVEDLLKILNEEDQLSSGE